MKGFQSAVYFFLFMVATFCAVSAPVILNEYNAVASDSYLGGGNAAADAGGGYACDTFWGRVPGNGGDWFELVVIQDHLDLRGWKLDIYENGVLDETLDLTNHPLWSDLRAGTIITVGEDLPTDAGYNPAAGDWWIHVQAADGADGVYIEPSGFPVSSSNWQLRIRNAAGTVVFGPAGEGVSPAAGIGSDEVFRLEADPSASIAANSPDYDGGSDMSTFGAPNQWGRQNFGALRTLTVPASSLTLFSPNGPQTIRAGSVVPVLWTWTGTVEDVLIEFSLNGGLTWQPVYPPNQGCSGRYDWLVPLVSSDRALVRVVNAGNRAVSDASDAAFSIVPCPLPADITGDCVVDLADLAMLAASWLE
ncbi:MAG TPA: hypothetical protein PK054_11705 [Anaerohalosphaeraceae bacterium]|nr:hypothetical protein [Anaerohalosphaeraceae bacterium]HPP57229.1 hypothetical protein [Anaerohalosphaeraceae bacterium]